MVNLIEAVAIVLVVLTLSMGWRMGVIISTSLVLTILGTFVVMSIQGIDLQRVSLGALVVALGIMELLSRRLHNIGFFRPIIPDVECDNNIQLILNQFIL